MIGVIGVAPAEGDIPTGTPSALRVPQDGVGGVRVYDAVTARSRHSRIALVWIG
jgi:hypothetical protein